MGKRHPVKQLGEFTHEQIAAAIEVFEAFDRVRRSECHEQSKCENCHFNAVFKTCSRLTHETVAVALAIAKKDTAYDSSWLASRFEKVE